MGDVIPNTRFPTIKTQSQRDRMRRRFARRPVPRNTKRDIKLPAPAQRR